MPAGVRGFLAIGTTLGTVPTLMLSQLYEVADLLLPARPGVRRGEGVGMRREDIRFGPAESPPAAGGW